VVVTMSNAAAKLYGLVAVITDSGGGSITFSNAVMQPRQNLASFVGQPIASAAGATVFSLLLSDASANATTTGGTSALYQNVTLGYLFELWSNPGSASVTPSATYPAPVPGVVLFGVSAASSTGGGGGGASANGAMALAPATMSGSASVKPTAAGTLTLAPATMSGSASIAGASPIAAGAMTLAPATLAGSASVAAVAAGAMTLAPATMSGSASVGAGATVAGEVIADPDGVALASATIPKVCYLRLSDMTVALNLTNQQTDATGMMSRSSPAFVAGTDYLRILSDATGFTTGCKVFRAA